MVRYGTRTRVAIGLTHPMFPTTLRALPKIEATSSCVCQQATIQAELDPIVLIFHLALVPLAFPLISDHRLSGFVHKDPQELALTASIY